MPATTWDPLNKGPAVVLSGSNLIATYSTAGGVIGVAATRNITGKTYWEVVVTAMTGVISVGAINRTFGPITSGSINQIGVFANDVGYRSNGQVLTASTVLATIQTYAQGDRIGIAVDPTVNPAQIWFNVNNGNWNNSGTNNPATGVGGISLALMTGWNLLPAVSAAASTPAAAVTAAFTTTTYTAPSGFLSPDTIQATGYNADTNISGSARFTADGPVRQDPVTTVSQRSSMPVAAGAWYGQGRQRPQWSPAAASKTISGVVTENGAPAAKVVRLFDRATGEFLAQTTSNPTTGAYSFPALNPAIAFDVMAFDTGYDALVHDAISGV